MKRPFCLLVSCLLAVTASAQDIKGTIKLSANWQQPDKKDDTARELGALLSKVAKPEMRLKVTETPIFLRNIEFLTPVMKAGQALGSMPGMRRSVNCPAFPKFSFFAHSLPVAMGDYDTVMLISDVANQLVAIQLLDENPRDAAEYDDEDDKQPWTAYDFIQQGAKGNKTWLVRAQVRKADKVSGERLDGHDWGRFGREIRNAGGDGWLVQIDTKLLRPEVSSSGYRSYRSSYRYEVQKRIRLFLPQPIADIVLSRVQYQLR